MIIEVDAPTETVEQYKLALQSIIRWCDRATSISHDDRIEYIRYVAWTALDGS